MLNIDKIIDEHNDTILKDKIDYYRTIDNIDTAEGTISAVSTLPEETFISVDATTRICNIKEHDQKEK